MKQVKKLLKSSLLIFLYLFSNQVMAGDLVYNQTVSAITKDKMQVFVDVNVSYQLHEHSQHDENTIELLSKNIKRSIFVFFSEISGTDSVLLAETKDQLLVSMQTDLKKELSSSNIDIKTLEIGKISLSEYVMQAIEARHRQQKAVAKQMAEIKKMKQQMQRENQASKNK